jgi:GT2 family glycosyltransferase
MRASEVPQGTITTRFANVTVAIATRDRSAALDRCLDAVLSGTALPTEIIVVDQSKNAQTREIVDKRHPSPVPIIYIRHQRRGLSAAQNVAFARATCPIVAITDDDCIPDIEWVATVERAFDAPPSPDGVTGRVLPFPGVGDRAYPVSSRTSVVRVDFQGKVVPWDVGSGNNFAVRREWLCRIGGCDERLGPGSPGKGGGDMDLFYRLLRAGARIRYEPSILVHHEMQSKDGRLARRSMYGHGMGVCCVLYLRQGDLYGLFLLRRWLSFRSWIMAGSLRRRRWLSAYEEALVLWGTLRGLAHGLGVRVSARART